MFNTTKRKDITHAQVSINENLYTGGSPYLQTWPYVCRVHHTLALATYTGAEIGWALVWRNASKNVSHTQEGGDVDL